VHNATVGHHGYERTIHRLQQAGQRWQGMRKDVKTFIASCPACQKASKIKTAINVPKFVLATDRPMQAIHVDSIGPLPPDEHNNVHILVMVDAFTRFVELYPIPALDTATAVRPLLNFVGRYGLPQIVHTDNGSQFKDVFHALLKRLNVAHSTITPHSHEENAIVERTNQEVMRHLRPLILDNPILKENWSDIIPLVQRIINSSINESIGTSPATLVFGTGINLDRNLFITDERSPFEEITSQSEWVEKMSVLQAEVIDAAQKQQAKTQQQHLFPREKVVRKPKPTQVDPQITEFNDRDFVLVEYPDGALGKRPPNKLMHRLKGPYQVVNHVGSKYTIRNLVTLKTEDVFVGQLRPFIHDPNRVIPRDIALKELAMYDVEDIMSHKGDIRGRKSQLTFKVRWLGYGPEQDTWEPWHGVFKTPAMHRYLTKIGHAKLIPVAYRPTAV
jgi:transposase InsO family protein